MHSERSIEYIMNVVICALSLARVPEWAICASGRSLRVGRNLRAAVCLLCGASAHLGFALRLRLVEMRTTNNSKILSARVRVINSM